MNPRIAIMVLATLCLAVAPRPLTADPQSPSAPPAPTYQWRPAASLPAATAGHSAVTLSDDSILVTGGYGKLFGRFPLAVSLARRYDPAADKWTALEPRLNYGRVGHASLSLPDGRVILVGGIGQDGKAMRSVELYDPEKSTFTIIGQMTAPRAAPRLNLLPDSQILITGNDRQAELIQIAPDKSLTIRPTKTPTVFHHVAHLALAAPDGKIYLLGGKTRNIEYYDPAAESFHRCQARFDQVYDDQAGALTAKNRFFIAGGQRVYSGQCVKNCWFYDPAQDQLTPGPTLNPHSGDIELPGVADIIMVDPFADDPARAGWYFLLAGGEYDPGRSDLYDRDQIVTSAWLWDVRSQRLLDIGPMPNGHDDFAAVPLGGTPTQREILIIGGHDIGDTFDNHCSRLTLTFPQE